MLVKKQQLNQTWNNGLVPIGKGVHQAAYCHPDYDTTFMAESEEELKSLLMKVKEDNENVA